MASSHGATRTVVEGATPTTFDGSERKADIEAFSGTANTPGKLQVKHCRKEALFFLVSVDPVRCSNSHQGCNRMHLEVDAPRDADEGGSKHNATVMLQKSLIRGQGKSVMIPT